MELLLLRTLTPGGPHFLSRIRLCGLFEIEGVVGSSGAAPGPYRFVRNPMAVAGIVQAIGVGLLASSWLTLLYAVCGIAYWHALVRPFEEADLEARFGERFRAYRNRVGTWVPRPRSSTSTVGSGADQSS